MSNLFEQLQHQAARKPEAIALWEMRAARAAASVTYAQLARQAAAYADQLRKVAFETTIVPLLLRKSSECVAAMLGAIGAGKAFACLNRKLRGPQINSILESILRHCEITTGLVDGPGVMTLASGFDPASPIGRTRWGVVEDASLLATQRTAREKLRASVAIEPWHVGQKDPQVPHIPEDASRLGCCLFTSGSTGTPKGVLIAAADLMARAEAEAEWFRLKSGDVLLSILPFSFDVGLNQLLSAIVAGCSVVLIDSWLPVDILKATEQFKVTGISGVPAIWSDMMVARMSFDTRGRHASLRYITLSGGDLAADQLARLPALAPDAGIFKTYGQSEDFRSSSLRPEEFAQHARSVGRAFPGTRVYVVRDDGSQCHSHEEGEIVHTGLGTMLGYLDGDDGERKLRPNPFCGSDDPAKIAVYTGDLGYLDDAGYLHVNGRRDAMLKIAGNRVYPREIVEQAMTIRGVREAEVVGAKTSDGQTHLVVFIVATPGAGVQTAPLIRRELAARLPSYMVPREVLLVDVIPRTASGKPDRPTLSERAASILSTVKM